MSEFAASNDENRFPQAVHGPNRFFRLSIWLRRSLIAVSMLALLALLLPETAASLAGLALVLLLIAIPLCRVMWFVQRWIRRGDLRFAAVAAGVLLVVAVGALLALRS